MFEMSSPEAQCFKSKGFKKGTKKSLIKGVNVAFVVNMAFVVNVAFVINVAFAINAAFAIKVAFGLNVFEKRLLRLKWLNIVFMIKYLKCGFRNERNGNALLNLYFEIVNPYAKMIIIEHKLD